MEKMRESWTDARLDDFREETARRFDTLERRMDNGFNRVDADLRGLREETNHRFDGVDAKIDALQHTLLQVGGGVIATLVAGFFGVILTQL
ncbi:MAG TPA: hypothetical protein VLK56_07715 [Solirubrobacterales bacterium]|nr:hypothetical protein [Solirubrobacterales bacterium]